MTADEYVRSVISNYLVLVGTESPAYHAGKQLYPVLDEWGHSSLVGVSFSGSYAKHTNIQGGTTFDLFISLNSRTKGSISDIYESLYSFLEKRDYAPVRRDVGIQIGYSEMLVDLIPAKKIPGHTTDHTIYHSFGETPVQTNLQQHVDLVRNSNCREIIKALKIWRTHKMLDFPSFYLELTVLAALAGRPEGQLANNLLAALEYLGSKFPVTEVVDPANADNYISEYLSNEEKARIADMARATRVETDWKKIIW